MTNRRIVLATGNPGKIREMRQVLSPLGISVGCVGEFGGIDEPEETGRTFAENARAKALYYARRTGQWCLADDSGLVVDALGGRPGVTSARYAQDRCDADAPRREITRANNAKLLEELADITDERRTARFVCHLALADAANILIEASGTLEGRIAREPAGAEGFGYDPLLYLPEQGCAVAQLTPEQKNAISHRGKAVRKFAAMLKEMLGERNGDADA